MRMQTGMTRALSLSSSFGPDVFHCDALPPELIDHAAIVSAHAVVLTLHKSTRVVLVVVFSSVSAELTTCDASFHADAVTRMGLRVLVCRVAVAIRYSLPMLGSPPRLTSSTGHFVGYAVSGSPLPFV